MFLLGLILMILGVGVGTLAVLGTRDETGTIALSAWGFTRESHPLELVAIGIMAMLLFALGWAAVTRAARRRARGRRDEREADRVADLEASAESARLEHERRFEDAGLRDEDLRHREDELRAWSAELDTRERELNRREAEWRDQNGPSVADVVTGRAHGRVSEGTAEWSDPSSSYDPDGTAYDERPTRHDLPTA